jgi:hypothetical protein
MRHLNRRSATIPAVVAAFALALTAFAGPVLAKESIDAQLDAPIARDTPAGTALLLGVWVTMTDETGTHDVDGSPIYVRLIGPDGSASSAIATQSRAGHYTVRVTVPKSGVKSVEVGMRGTTDLPFNLVGFTVVKGPIRAGTARVVPAIAAASDPVARASVAAPRVAPPVVPAAEPATSVAAVSTPVDAGPGPLVGAVIAVGAVALGSLAIIRTRIAARPRLSGRSPGA